MTLRSKSLIVPFTVSLFIIPVAFAVAMMLGGSASGAIITNVLRVLTLLVEVTALAQVISARRLFASSDPGYLAWLLISASIAFDFAGNVRFVSITLGIVPRYTEGAPTWLFFYVVVGRYLFVLGSLLFAAALITMIRAYKSTGLRFEMMMKDYLYIALLWAVPAVTWFFREELIYFNPTGTDRYAMRWRLVFSFACVLAASLCVTVRRYASQMGGGAVAQVWNMMIIGGVALTASFIATLFISKWWAVGGEFAEAYLVWIMPCCWLIGALYQQEVLSGFAKSPTLATAEG